MIRAHTDQQPCIALGLWLNRTFVTVTFTGAMPCPEARMAVATSFKLIFATWLLWSMSLIPSAPPSLLEKNTSSVFGTQIGASWANAKVAFAATARMVALGPRIFRKSGWNTWKNGGLELVGLKNSSVADVRKDPLMPSTLNASGSTSCAHSAAVETTPGAVQQSVYGEHDALHRFGRQTDDTHHSLRRER